MNPNESNYHFHGIFMSFYPNNCFCYFRLFQPSATSPLFFDNLHFEHFDKSVNHESRLTLLSKCSKWRLSKNRGLVADGRIVLIYVFHTTFDRGLKALLFLFATMLTKRRFGKAEKTFGNVFSNHFSIERSPNRVLTYVKSALKIRSRRFARPSQIFAW